MMKPIFVFFLSVSLVFSQSKELPTKGVPADKNLDSASVSDDDLDKLFYQYYFYQKEPDFEDIQKAQNITTKTNLIQALKNEIYMRDPANYEKASKEIEAPDAKVKFKQVSRYSVWMKKIKKEIGYVTFTDFMYVIQYDKYIALALYMVDPKKHLLSPTQVELIIKKEGKKDID